MYNDTMKRKWKDAMKAHEILKAPVAQQAATGAEPTDGNKAEPQTVTRQTVTRQSLRQRYNRR